MKLLAFSVLTLATMLGACGERQESHSDTSAFYTTDVVAIEEVDQSRARELISWKGFESIGFQNFELINKHVIETLNEKRQWFEKKFAEKVRGVMPWAPSTWNDSEAIQIRYESISFTYDQNFNKCRTSVSVVAKDAKPPFIMVASGTGLDSNELNINIGETIAELDDGQVGRLTRACKIKKAVHDAMEEILNHPVYDRKED